MTTELTASSIAGPTLRERLFRPNRWRLWVQFALLGAFVLIIPILLTSFRLLDEGRQVLIEHEIIDLSDESNLRVNEMREDLAFLARDVRRAVADGESHAPRDLLRKLRREVRPVPANFKPSPTPESVRESRQKYMPGTVVGFCIFRLAERGLTRGGEVEILDFEAGPDEALRPAPAEAALECLREVAVRAARQHSIYNSTLHLLPAEGALPPRCLIAIGAQVIGAGTKDRPLLAAVILDFSRYIDNRRRISPRHAYIVADPQGTILIHPDPGVSVGQQSLPDLIPWSYPKDDHGEVWFSVLNDSKARDRRFAQAVHSGGARLPMIPVPTLNTVHRKGFFDKPLKEILADRTESELQTLNELLAQDTAADPFMRCGEVTANMNYIELAHREPATLKAQCDKIESWLARVAPGQKLKWTHPLPCTTFQGQMTPLRVDLNDEDPPPWLVVAASKEELQEDIDDRFRRVQYRWILPTVFIAGVLGFGLVVTLTWSVQRLAKAARQLSADQDKVQVPLNGPYEVAQLAYVLSDMARKVAEREREVRERAARYETILRAAGEGIIITNSQGLIEEANKAAGRMFGVRPEALIGRPVTSLVNNPDVLGTLDSSLRDHETGASRSLDSVKGRRLDGSLFWLEVSLKPVPLRDRVVVTCVFRDISQRKEAEDRIRKMNDELERRVQERTAELEEAKGHLEIALEQAEMAARAKDTFVANMSHELRQPLHIIIGFTEALKEDADSLTPEDIVKDLNKILMAAQHLLELINDILDLANIMAGRMKLNIARFELAKLLEDVRTLVAPLADKRSNRFIIETPQPLGWMISDERRVRQILINLLSNAFKFTQNGTVTLRVIPISEGGRPLVRFAVIDTGRGLTPEEQARLFERFYMADSSTKREQGGSGLGLTITQGLTELMGGPRVEVSSTFGAGSEFVVKLPVEVTAGLVPKPARTAGSLAPTGSSPQAAGRTVLVVDDDAMVRELMSRFLAKEGFRVVQAESAEEAIRMAREQKPCVMTLDVMMPGSDGWSVLARLKSDPETRDIPVVMLTIVDDRGRGFALGAADYLTKPIDWQRLGTILRKFLTPGRDEPVLLIEDVEPNREVIRRYLERENCRVVEATNGEEGLQAFARQKPGLILLDLMMPVMDGFGFLDELERRFPGHRVPVIVLTAKELTAMDLARLQGRVSKVLEKGDLTHLDKLVQLIHEHAAKTTPGN